MYCHIKLSQAHVYVVVNYEGAYDMWATHLQFILIIYNNL